MFWESQGFIDYVVLLVMSCNECQHALGWFAVECEAASVISKFEAMALNHKLAEYALSWLGMNVDLDFKYLEILLRRDEKGDRLKYQWWDL